MEHVKILFETSTRDKCIELVQDKMKNIFYYVRILSNKVDGVYQRTEKPCETGSYRYALRRFKQLKKKNGFNMETNLPDYISTVEDAQKFLTELHANKESYHPEDDANDIIWALKVSKPTKNELEKLNKLMLDIYTLPDFEPDFDPCEFLDNLIHS